MRAWIEVISGERRVTQRKKSSNSWVLIFLRETWPSLMDSVMVFQNGFIRSRLPNEAIRIGFSRMNWDWVGLHWRTERVEATKRVSFILTTKPVDD